MNKSELIQAIADEAAMHKNDVGACLDGLVEVVKRELKNGNDITLVGFGTFTVTAKPERQGRNPKTGEPLTIAAHKTPKFKPGKALKDAVN